MIQQRSPRQLPMLALVTLAIVLASPLTYAQGPSPGEAPPLGEIRTTVTNFPPGALPLSVTYEYELGATETQYRDNGQYSEPGAEGKRALKGVTIYGKYVPLNTTTVIPSATGVVTVTTTVTTYEKDGVTYVLVVVTITMSDP